MKIITYQQVLAREAERLELQDSKYKPELHDALRSAERQAGRNGLVAPLWLILKASDAYNTGSEYLSNSEEIIGTADDHTPFGNKGDAFVVTWHCGLDNHRILTSDVIQRALSLNNEDVDAGLTPLGAADLVSVYGKSVFTDLLKGKFPDGNAATLFSYDQVKSGEHYNHMKSFRGFGIVRPLNLAMEKESALYDIADVSIVDKGGQIVGAKHSQIVAYTAGVNEGGDFLRLSSNLTHAKVGVRHNLHKSGFDPEQEQASMLVLGFPGYAYIQGGDNLKESGAFIVAPSETVDALLGENKRPIADVSLDDILGIINNPDFNREDIIKEITKKYS